MIDMTIMMMMVETTNGGGRGAGPYPPKILSFN
jgi:hypothetical protein